MKVLKSRLIGFCRGVEKTVEKASECLDRADELNLPCYSIGRLINNNDVVSRFEKMGMKTIESPDCKPGIALIRAHGISDSLRQDFENSGFTLVDSTCPVIISTKEKIKKAMDKGRTVVLIGDPVHPEVKGISDTFALKPVYDIESTESLVEKLDRQVNVSVFTQTTFNYEMYGKIIGILSDHFADIEKGNSLCSVCSERKKSVSELFEKCDVIVVAGSPQSHNTSDIVRFIKKSGKPVVAVENEKSFDESLDSYISGFGTAGVCSGTSTPESVIDKVVRHLEAL